MVTTRGKGFEEEIVKLITDTTGLQATTSIRSAIRALAHLGMRNVVVLSPYPQDLHQSALRFLSASDFTVVADHTEDVVGSNLVLNGRPLALGHSIICHYANPNLYLKGDTIKNDHHGPTDKEMRLSSSAFRIDSPCRAPLISR